MYYAALWLGCLSRLGNASHLCGDCLYVFGLDALSEELEEPFGMAANQLPLTALSRTIEINLLEALGEPDLPPAIAPINDYLS
ncbi:hypothetical protein Psyaliredsea_13100 [Psychrobacter alimentarius]